MEGSERPVEAAPALTCWGAAQTVTGSQHLVSTAGGSLLLDCGIIQGRREETDRRNSSFPFRVDRLSAVLLTHAHIDHCGNLPSLVRQGYRGPIYCTPMTAELAAVMLADSAKLQEEESAQAIIRRRYSSPWVEPLYTLQDSARTTGLLTPIEYDTPVVVAPGVTALFTDAGHVPGSAVIHLRIEQYGHRYSLTYTGDLGRPGFGVLPPPAPLPPAGLVLCESTYGGRQHPDPSTTEAALADAVSRAATAGGKLIIPAFGFGRTQIIVHFLLKAMREGAAPNLPIFVDSPLASQVAAVFRRHPEAFAVDLPGDQAAVRYVTSMEESASLPDRPGSAIIIAAGGMGDGGRVAGHLMKTVSDPANVIALVSFQAPRSLGRQLLERPEFITLFGKDRPLRAEVRHLEGYSSHADHDDLISQLKPLIARQPMVRFVHGEPTAAGALADDLRAAGLRDIAIPAVGEVMELLPDAD